MVSLFRVITPSASIDPTNLVHPVTGGLIVQIVRRAAGSSSDDRQNDFDPNPLLSMATTILKHNKAHSRDFIAHLEQCLHIALIRFDIHEQTLRELLRATSSLYKRVGVDQTTVANGRKHSNTIVNLLVETLSEVLRGKLRSTSMTLTALVEVRVHLLLFVEWPS